MGKQTEQSWADRPLSERLEHVRENVVGLRFSAFRDRLVAPRFKGDPYSVSYSAVQNYHTTHRGESFRVPPADYLQRVCTVFGVRPEWLLMGAGEPTRAEEEARERGESAASASNARFVEAFAESLPWVAEGESRYATAALFSAWAGLSLQTVSRPPHYDQQRLVDLALARRLSAAVAAPLAALRLRGNAVFSARKLERYVVGVCEAISTLVDVHDPTTEFAEQPWEELLEEMAGWEPSEPFPEPWWLTDQDRDTTTKED